MAEIRDLGGRPAIFVDGKFYPPMMATIRTMRGGEEIIFDKEYFTSLGKAGIRIFFLICDTLWLKPDAIRLFDEEATLLLEAIPDAYIIPRIGMHPPKDWVVEHPEECVTYSDGTIPAVHLFSESYETDYEHHYSLSSEAWRRDAAKALRRTWGGLMRLPYADRIIGCFLAAGGTSEWYYMLPSVNDKTKAVAGHSKAFREEFSRYLGDVYGNDENLRRHWKNPDASIAAPAIPEYEKHFFINAVDSLAADPRIRMYTNNPPPPEPSNGTNVGSFPDFDSAIDVYDFYRAWNLGSARSVLAFAETIKEMTPDKLVGAFYGSQGCTQYISAGTSGGTVEILNSPFVDFLAAPGVYENRQSGGFVGQREVQDSFALHNKIYIVEDDTRTLAENKYFKHRCEIYDMTDSIDVMKREFGRTIAEDVQAWWFDQLIGGRRYKYPEIYSLIEKQQKIAEEAYTLDRKKASEIALIFDEESLQGVSLQTTRDCVELFRNYELARIGAPVDQYYHNDMSLENMPSYKLYIFMNTFILTKAERDAIKEKLRRDGATALWIYAPGYVDPEAEVKMSCEHIKDLTGFECEALCERLDPIFRWTESARKISENLDTRALYGKFERRRRMMLLQSNQPSSYYDTYLYPMIYPTDGEVMARFCTYGQPAVTYKECDGFRSVFYGSKSICAEVVREIARFAGCHIWEEDSNVLYANASYITHHSSESGEKTVYLPGKYDVYDAYEGDLIAHGVDQIKFTSYFGQTRTFRIKRC